MPHGPSFSVLAYLVAQVVQQSWQLVVPWDQRVVLQRKGSEAHWSTRTHNSAVLQHCCRHDARLDDHVDIVMVDLCAEVGQDTMVAVEDYRGLPMLIDDRTVIMMAAVVDDLSLAFA